MGKSRCPGLVRDARPHTLSEKISGTLSGKNETMKDGEEDFMAKQSRNPRLLTGGMHPHLWLFFLKSSSNHQIDSRFCNSQNLMDWKLKKKPKHSCA